MEQYQDFFAALEKTSPFAMGFEALSGSIKGRCNYEEKCITDVHQMTNQQLKRLIQKIEVDKDGNVDIYLRLLGDLGLDESVLIDENETVQKCNNQT